MLIATKGIVFKALKFQDSSLIVKMLTEEKGLQSFLVKGIRTTKASGKAAYFQPGMMLEIVMYFQENKNLKTLKEYKPFCIYQNIFDDIGKSSVLIFIMEVMEQCIHEDEFDMALFTFLEDTLLQLDVEDNVPNHHLFFMLNFMKYLGIYPNGQYIDSLPYFSIKEGEFIAHFQNGSFTLKKEESQLFSQFLHESLVKINRNERKILLDILLQYYTYHLENFKGVKSLKVLESILA